jgi:hypothetical protein
VGPATERVLLFDPPELVDRLIHDVSQSPGTLPLLSFTLSELYLKCVERGGTDRRLTLEDYRSMGYLSGSLSNRADALVNAMDAPHQATLRRVMLRLCDVEGPEPVKRRVTLSEFVYDDPTENSRAEEIISQWTSQHRLLVRDTMIVRHRSKDPPSSGAKQRIHPWSVIC